MGLTFLNCSLEAILGIKGQLSMFKEGLPFPIDELLKVAEAACQNDLGRVQLLELVDAKASYEKSTECQKLLKEESTKQLVNLFNQKYKGVIDIQSYAREIWECIRVGEATCSNGSKSNNDSKTRIHLIHSSIDQSTLDQLMGVFADLAKPILEPILGKPLKVINGMDLSDELKLTDIIIPAYNGICKRENSFRSGRLEKIWKNLHHQKFYQLSLEECKKYGYQPNVNVTISKGYVHEPLPLPGQISRMLLLPNALLDSRAFWPVFMNHVDDCLRGPIYKDDDLDQPLSHSLAISKVAKKLLL